MANLQKIKVLAKEKGVTINDLAEQLGITPQAIHLMVRENSTKTDTLERIANILNVPISAFFDEGNIEIKDNERSFNSNADDIIKELTSIIRSQEERIRQLTDKLLGL